MRIKIVAVGKLKERYFKEAVEEYAKRISKYAYIDISEVKEESSPSNSSQKEVEKILYKEKNRLEKRIDKQTFLVTLTRQGEQVDSKSLASHLEKLMVTGTSSITFAIGGDLGLHPSLLSEAKWKLSFSKLTFPHHLMRVLLCEQLYRSFTIINNEPYHRSGIG